MIEIGLYAAVAPLCLLLLSAIWRYPAVLEEVVKWGILRTNLTDIELRGSHGAIVGLIFGVSEMILYSVNAWNQGQWIMLGNRLIVTVPMHVLTAWIIAITLKNRRGYVGLCIAMILHGSFNYLMGLIA